MSICRHLDDDAFSTVLFVPIVTLPAVTKARFNKVSMSRYPDCHAILATGTVSPVTKPACAILLVGQITVGRYCNLPAGFSFSPEPPVTTPAIAKAVIRQIAILRNVDLLTDITVFCKAAKTVPAIAGWVEKSVLRNTDRRANIPDLLGEAICTIPALAVGEVRCKGVVRNDNLLTSLPRLPESGNAVPPHATGARDGVLGDNTGCICRHSQQQTDGKQSRQDQT